MTLRKSTGKRLRFEVFKRDHFTCQYCGAQPLDVVLVIDHITAVALGGTSTIDNLITACESCNQGKTDRALDTRQVRPDADLLYLETQQEIAELQRYQWAKQERDELLTAIIAQLQEEWCQHADTDWSPADRIVRQLLAKYGPEIVEASMQDVAIKIGTGYLRADRGSRWVGYLYKVAATMAQESEDEEGD